MKFTFNVTLTPIVIIENICDDLESKNYPLYTKDLLMCAYILNK